LPAPFGPINPTTSPGSVVKLTSERASVVPKRTLTLRTSSTRGATRVGVPPVGNVLSAPARGSGSDASFAAKPVVLTWNNYFGWGSTS